MNDAGRSSTSVEPEWDTAVIGAGVAGCVIARELALEGFRVLLVESKPFPRAKVCGACLNGLALSVFERAGLMDIVRSAGAVPLRRLEAMRRGMVVRVPIPNGAAVSRSVLDTLLAEAAVNAGAAFLDSTTATVSPARLEDGFREVRLQSHDGAHSVRAKIVIVAAGLGRSCFGPDTVHQSRFAKNAKLGAGCILSDAPLSFRPGVIHMSIGRHGYLGMVRIENDQLNVAGAFEPAFLKSKASPGAAALEVLRESGFEELPGLVSARWIGTPPLTRRTRPLADHRLFLVGDAAGYVEPFTGEGMGWALASVMALKPLVERAVDRWNPQFSKAWETEYERTVGRRQGLCRGLATILNRPVLSGIVFRAARFAPALTSRIVRRIDAPTPPAATESMLFA
jgi:flavin-dependent dehydrogenase